MHTVLYPTLRHMELSFAFAAFALLLNMTATAATANNKRGLDTPNGQASATPITAKIGLDSAKLAAGTAGPVTLPSLGRSDFITHGIEVLVSGNKRWTGLIRSASQSFPAELILTPSAALGDVRVANGRLRFEPDGTIGQSVTFLPPSSTSMENCAVSQFESLRPKSTGIVTKAATAKVAEMLASSLKSSETASIDVMFVYTPRVESKYGAQLTAVLDSLIATANSAARNSQAQITFRQVAPLKVSPRRIIAGDLVAALKAVAASDDPTLPSNTDFSGVASKRVQMGADIVVFLTAFGDYSVGCSGSANCMVGAAYQTSAESLAADDPGKRSYAIVDVAAQDLALTFIHEVGHLLGAGHDLQTGGGGLFDDSNGFRWDRGNAGDIMSYAPNRELVFSNPDLTCGSGKCGSTIEQGIPADNAKALKSARFLVANFRATKAASVGNMSGLWSAQSDSSTLHLSQRGRVMTAVWTQFDGSGKPTWLIVPNCLIDGLRCKGDLYRSWTSAGALTDTTPLVPKFIFSGGIGSVDLDMSDALRPSMRYDIYGDEKIMLFNRGLPASMNVADDQTVEGSWWMSMEPGPGVTITRNQNALYLQWFSFDNEGRPTWFVAPSCQLVANGRSCAGDLFRNTIPADSGKTVLADSQKIGRASVDFLSAYAGTLNVDINGRMRSAAIEREMTLD